MAKKQLKSPAANSGAHLKRPISGQASPTDHLPPIFSLASLKGNYCVTACTAEEKIAFIETLHRLSAMSWREIRNAPRHGLGSEKISRNSIKGVRIPDEVTEDTTLLAIRFCAMAPMIGYRSGQAFHVLWLDRSFTVYAH